MVVPLGFEPGNEGPTPSPVTNNTIITVSDNGNPLASEAGYCRSNRHTVTKER